MCRRRFARIMAAAPLTTAGRRGRPTMTILHLFRSPEWRELRVPVVVVAAAFAAGLVVSAAAYFLVDESDRSDYWLEVGKAGMQTVVVAAIIGRAQIRRGPARHGAAGPRAQGGQGAPRRGGAPAEGRKTAGHPARRGSAAQRLPARPGEEDGRDGGGRCHSWWRAPNIKLDDRAAGVRG